MEYGKVYLVPTPIGNLKDITLRALEVLENVDEVAAEDTRQSLKLLNHFNIKKPLFSYHQHNEQGKSDEILSLNQDTNQQEKKKNINLYFLITGIILVLGIIIMIIIKRKKKS